MASAGPTLLRYDTPVVVQTKDRCALRAAQQTLLAPPSPPLAVCTQAALVSTERHTGPSRCQTRRRRRRRTCCTPYCRPGARLRTGNGTAWLYKT